MDELAAVEDSINQLLRECAWPKSEGVQLIRCAVVLGEDRRFYEHRGVDPLAIVRALVSWLVTRRISGASTIEQQLVRTIRGRYEVTLNRKFSEILLAVRISSRFEKRELLDAYLCCAYFGTEAVGLAQIARRGGIELSNVGHQEAAWIAALLKVPLPLKPSVERQERIRRRAQHIGRLLAKYGEATLSRMGRYAP